MYGTQVRWESMQHLSHFPPGDLVTSESWLLLRAALKDALGDGDRRVAVSGIPCRGEGGGGAECS